MPLVLEVRANGVTVQATGIVPEAPVLTAPTSDTVFTLTDSITVAWTSTTNPDGSTRRSSATRFRHDCTRLSASSDSCTVTDFRSSSPNESHAPIRSSSQC